MNLQEFKAKLREKVDLERNQLFQKGLNLEMDYAEKFCMKCIGTEKQKRRSCDNLDDTQVIGCRTMDQWINKRMKSERKKCAKQDLILFALQVLELRQEQFLV